MTVRRLFAILFIFAVSTLAWFTLGLSIVERTGRSNSESSHAVAALWGGQHRQTAPTASHYCAKTIEETVVVKDPAGRESIQRLPRQAFEAVPVELVSSDVEADLFLEHRRKGLLWHDTYSVEFRGRYVFVAPDDLRGPINVSFSFPSQQAIYDRFEFRVNGETAPSTSDLSAGLEAPARIEPGEEVVVDVAYHSRGLDTWRYLFSQPGDVAAVRDFSLTVRTDFDGLDFPPDTLSPSGKSRSPTGWVLTWKFGTLLSAKAIGIDLPNRLNPGPLAARITFFAPVSLLFFITILVMLGVLGHLKLHPMHYFFLSTAFFAFHLLLSYLADHLDIHAAFTISSLTSVALVVSYLRLVCGVRRALLYAGGAQLVWLVLFSYAFFYEGYTGLTITVGAIATLFLLMQLTGRVEWDDVFAARGARLSPASPDSARPVV